MEIITEHIRIDSNPLNSRRFQSLIKGHLMPGNDLEAMVSEIIKDKIFNILYIPIWIFAFETVAAALKTATPEEGVEVYEALKSHTEINAISFKKEMTEDD